MIYIKTPINGCHADDLYSFISGITYGYAPQIKIEKGYLGDEFYYKIEVAYPDFSDRFIWDCNKAPAVFAVGVTAAISVTKPLLELGSVIIDIEKGASLGPIEERGFVISYFSRKDDIQIEHRRY